MRKRNSSIERVIKHKTSRLVAALLTVLLVLQISGCTTVSYYSQSIVGHSKLMLARQPLKKAISQAQQRGNLALVEQLTLAVNLRQFAVKSLHLPQNRSYQSYVDLQRDFPVWTVVAADEFSLTPKQWCYLIIGCASYRGYFSRAAATAYAHSLEEAGFDVAVGGTPAYSTLGWFADPLLPSMMRYGEAQFAETLFHELAHQVYYLNGESDFNEAFATTVGEQGAKIWLRNHNPAALGAYEESLSATEDFNQLLLTARGTLEQVYSEQLDAMEKRAEKRRILQQFRQDYDQLKATKWSNKGWFDTWFETPINNARLVAVATYRDKVPAFEALLEDCGADFKRFLMTVKSLNKKAGKVRIPTQCKS